MLQHHLASGNYEPTIHDLTTPACRMLYILVYTYNSRPTFLYNGTQPRSNCTRLAPDSIASLQSQLLLHSLHTSSVPMQSSCSIRLLAATS
jgi:hypothetical protein